MAPRGRPPKPVELKQLTGNPGRRPLPVPAVTLPAARDVPSPPDGLSEVGALFWSEVWTAARLWLSPAIDSPLVELAARTLDEIAQYRELSKRPLLSEPIVTPAGQVVG